MILKFIENQVSQIEEDRVNLFYSQEKYIEFNNQLKVKMTEKMDIYSELRSNNKYINNSLVFMNTDNFEILQNP